MRKIISVLLSVLVLGGIAAKAQEPKKIAVTTDVSYRTGNSESWKLDIMQPENFGEAGLRPAIVIVHGGGWAGGSKTVDVYRGLMMDYTLQGYVTLNVEYRLTGEAGFPACIEDVKCAIRWLKAHAAELRVDPDRIGVYGHSAGAHLSLMIGVSAGNKALEGDGPYKEYSSSVTCVAAGSPPTEIGNPNSPWASHEEWWPIGYFAAAKTAAPQLLIQGKSDPIVRPVLTDDYVEKMKAAGADIEYLKVEGDHDVAYSDALNITKPAMDAFFAKHLKK